ncbi:hypothetical protein K3495_g7328 [Podosphaera aphanis]|nr:hypothetical protein K3495_g7328 [Podosphaera aphanis]
MAHFVKLAALTDELIYSVISPAIESDPTKHSSLRKSVLRGLRQHNYTRTNQFDIHNQLDGLEEKFRIYGEELLADAIHERRARLEDTKTKWSPEILQLILELSERPLSNTNLDDLGFGKGSPSENQVSLKWNDLALHDPLLQEKSVWENVNFADQSTDGENDLEDTNSNTDSYDSTLSVFSNKDFQNQPTNTVAYELDNEGLKKLRESQFWQKKSHTHNHSHNNRVKKSITDLQAIRELLFMFGGYPTSLFKMKSQNPVIIEASEDFTLENISQFSYSNLLESLADHGSAIMTLRFWTKDRKKTPLLQVLQLTIQERLADFDTSLSNIHRRFVMPTQDVIVSILGIKQELVSMSRPFIYLAEITKKLDKAPYGHSFRYLEMLYDQICISQMTGDNTVYSFLGKIFFKCFRIYLRPIRAWIEEGELTQGDTSFFITETTGQMDPTLLWESRFKIRTTPDGLLHAPRFLEPAANRIITTGKSIIVLKCLNQSDLLELSQKRKEPILNFETVCDLAGYQLAPFSELFGSAFEAWVRSKHHHATSILRDTLYSSCGLHTSLDALSHIYFLADGSLGSNLLNPIFADLDAGKEFWNNRYSLTEHAQSVFASVSSINSERLRVSVLNCTPKYRDVEKCRKTVKALETIEFDFQLLWPIQIVITSATIRLYQRIFTFLAQVRRSSYILSRQSMKSYQLNNTRSSDEQALYYSLRMRLLWFSQILYYYLTSLVLDQCSQKMQANLRAAEDVDMIIEVHSAYIKRCIDQALLGPKLELIHNTILRILDLGIKLEDAHVDKTSIGQDVMTLREDTIKLSLTNLEPDTNDDGNLAIPGDENYRENLDLSIASSLSDENEPKELDYAGNLRHIRVEFYRLLNFVARGLKGIARAAGSEDARLWDKLGEMFESGLKSSEDE